MSTELPIQLKRPLCSFDIESTGVDPVLDRILTLSMVKLHPDGQQSLFEGKYNGGGKEMTPETIAVHGITNEQAAQWPAFAKAEAKEILKFIDGCDLVGFNSSNFDAIMLWEEMYRVGVTWDYTGLVHVDVGTLYKIFEPRTLPAAVRFYLNRDHEGAHDSTEDAKATLEVFLEQVTRYPELWDMDMPQMAKHSMHGEVRCDLSGKIVMNAEGVPVYAFGKSKGNSVEADPGLGLWMLGKDFPESTKIIVRALVNA